MNKFYVLMLLIFVFLQACSSSRQYSTRGAYATPLDPDWNLSKNPRTYSSVRVFAALHERPVGEQWETFLLLYPSGHAFITTTSDPVDIINDPSPKGNIGAYEIINNEKLRLIFYEYALGKLDYVYKDYEAIISESTLLFRDQSVSFLEVANPAVALTPKWKLMP